MDTNFENNGKSAVMMAGARYCTVVVIAFVFLPSVCLVLLLIWRLSLRCLAIWIDSATLFQLRFFASFGCFIEKSNSKQKNNH